eukprot:gene5388-4175_t
MFYFDTELGLVLADDRPVLRSVRAGSPATQCAGINACIGMQLLQVGNSEVADCMHAARLLRSAIDGPLPRPARECSVALVFSMADDSPSDLAGLLAQRSNPQTLGTNDPTNGRRCDRCAPQGTQAAAAPHRPFRRVCNFWHAPRHLVVQIMRFRHDGTKMLAPVRLPSTPFRVSFLAEPSALEPIDHWYRVLSCACHLGMSRLHGHYVTLVRGISEGRASWRMANDSRTARPSDVLPTRRYDGTATARGVYLLLLERVSGPATDLSASESANQLSAPTLTQHWLCKNDRCLAENDGTTGRMHATPSDGLMQLLLYEWSPQ